MYYIIQKNIFNDPRYSEIFTVLKRLGLPYEEVIFQPNSTHFDIETDRKDIFVYGSVKLAKVSTTFDWYPGSFYGGNHAFQYYAQGYGKYLINYKSTLANLSDPINWSENTRLFIKPSEDAKCFTGKVFTQPEWEDFVYYSLKDPHDNRVTPCTQIQISHPSKLIKEARIWIVNKQVVTGCYYRFHDTTIFEADVSTTGIAFAQKMAQHYSVADAYVMDIALTYDGWKIIEVNCINSAGFYGADIEAIILALEAFYNTPPKPASLP